MCDKVRLVAIPVQESLFALSDRRQLGEDAWLDVRPGWLSDHSAELVSELQLAVPWRAERRRMYDRVLDVPRLVSFHDLAVDAAPHPTIAKLRRRLNDIYAGELGEPFTTVGLCLYRDGARQRRLARRHPRPGRHARTPSSRSSASAPPARSHCGHAAAALRCGYPNGTATWW